MPIEFDHITAPSGNLDTSIRFYKHLGMTLIEVEPNHHAHFENKAHNTIFTIYYNTKRPDHDVIMYFEVTEIALLEVRFRESKHFIKKIIPSSWGGDELHLKDPDENYVILYQKNKVGQLPPWQITTHES